MICYNTEKHQMEVLLMNENHQSFFKGSGGRIVITIIFTVVIWGLVLGGVAARIPILTAIIAIVCAYFGWRILNTIQPSMFLWMSWVGWLFYFVFKFLLAVVIGLFVAPFSLGKIISEKIRN